MGFSSRCGICTHPQAELINNMLRRKALGDTSITHRHIMRVVAEAGGPVLTEWGLSRHASKHFDVHAEARKRAAEMYEQAADEGAEKVVSDLEFLDHLRDRAFELLEKGDLKPDLKDALQAINIKHGKVMKNDDPLQALVDMVADVCCED